MRTVDALAVAAGELAAETALEPGSCPDAEEWIAYHAGELTAAEEARLQDHLLLCAEDRALLLDLERLRSGELGIERSVSEFELAAARRELRTRLEARSSSRPRSKPRPTRSPWWLQALAASLAVAVLGLSGWVFALRQSLDATSRPQLNTIFADLSSGTLRSGEDDVEVLALSPEDRHFTLVFHPIRRDPGEQLDDEYAVEIERAGGDPVWSAPGLRRNELGYLTLTLWQRQVGAGEYRIRLFSAGKPRGDPAFEFALRIEVTSEER